MKTMIKNSSKTVYAEKYPVLWRRLLNFLEDCDDVKPEEVTQKTTFSKLGLSAEDCFELTMNLELTTGLYGFADGLPDGIHNMTIERVLDLITTKNNYKDVEY